MKVGDRVKITNTDFADDKLANGQTGIIVHNYGHVFGIDLDSGHKPILIDEDDPKPYSWAFYPSQLEVVE